MENLNLFIRSIFVDNMVFAYFLGMCSFLAVSKNVKTAFGLGVAVTFMLVITLPINYLLQTYVLQAGALSWLGPDFADVDLSFLSLIMFIAEGRFEEIWRQPGQIRKSGRNGVLHDSDQRSGFGEEAG